MEFPDTTFIVAAYVSAAILVTICMAVMRGSFRVSGAPSWILLALLAPLPVLVGIPIAGLTALNTEAALPATGISIVAGLIWIHFILPALVPDYSPGNFGASCLPAVLIGAAVMIGGVAGNTFPQGMGLGHETSTFEGKSAGVLDEGDLGAVLKKNVERGK
ncbi:hypothetical protein BH09SUM1_BH09SUM1_24190 [soil metagenome]